MMMIRSVVLSMLASFEFEGWRTQPGKFIPRLRPKAQGLVAEPLQQLDCVRFTCPFGWLTAL